MPSFGSRLFALFAVLLIAACAEPLGPEDVAREFWNALEQGDTRAVKRHVKAADAATLGSLDDVLPVSNATFDRIVIDGDVASIATTVTIEGDKALQFPLQTHLVREEAVWKVDYDRTIAAVANAGKLAAVIDKVHEFGNTLQQGIERSVEELESTLPQIEQELSRIEGEIKQRVPELRNRLERFARELQNALERPPSEDPGPVTPPTPESPGSAVEI